MASSLQDLSRSFARELRAEQKADRTVTLYTMSVQMFADWLRADGREPTLDNLNRGAIREWMASLADRGNSPETVRTRHRGLFRFCRWCVAEGELEANPMENLSPPAPKATPVPILSDDDLKALLATCPYPGTFADRRDEAMIRVLLDCGLRVSELCGLTVAGTDLDDERAMVTGKGGKIRPVYFSPRTIRALDRYLRQRSKHRFADAEALFLSQRGPISADGVRERIAIRAQQAGLDHIHPHQFRHTFAHDFLMSGGNPGDLKRLAGWSSDVMLERYGASGADVRARAAAKQLRRGDRV